MLDSTLNNEMPTSQIHPVSPASSRKAYSAPELIEYGPVAALTQGGSISGDEGGGSKFA